MIPFPENLGRRRRDCDSERRVRTARCLVFAGWHNVEMLAVPPSGRGPLYVSVLELWSGLGCRRELNVSSPPVFPYFFYHIVAETDLREAILRIAV